MGDLVMTMTTAIVGGALALTYTVRNEAAQDAYLLNRMFTDSPPAMTADIAWVELDTAGLTARVMKGIPDVPVGSSGPPVPMAPYVTPLRVGASFTETIHLPMPLRSMRAYGRSPPPKPGQDKLVMFHRLSFELQYYWRETGITETPSTAFGQPVVLPGGFQSPPRFGMLRASTGPVEIPVTLPAP